MTGINRRELLRGMLASGVSAALPVGTTAALVPGIAAAAPAAAQNAAPVGPLGDATLAPRERLLFDFGWRFHLGHASDASRDFDFGTFQRTFAKAGKDTATAAQAGFDDSGWQQVDLPHDWAVTLPFRQEPISATMTEEDPAAAHGYKALGTSFPENSVGWYRRTMQIPASDLGKRICLVFDGVFRDCIVFCNGHIVGRNASGYCGFEVDLSEVLDYGKPNVIAVRVDATLGEGWFYEGAGIYRHLWLQKTDPLHVPQDGVVVRSSIDSGNVTAQVSTEVRNDGAAPRQCIVQTRITAPDGRVVAQSASAAITLAPGQLQQIEQTLPLGQAMLWSIDTPQLYSATTSVHSDGRATDAVVNRFGVRSIAFDAQRGFLLNGTPLKLHGTNNHQDHAGVGTAIPDALHEWRLRQLKSMGCNAYRSSHNPATPELLALCDRLGMFVIEETRRMSTDTEAMGELETMVRRGRNHPSVILWSLGNEEPQQVTERGARIVSRMQQRVHQLDPTRPTTFAMDKGFGDGVGQVVDVVGFNYRTSQMDGFHAQYPDIPIYGSETGSTVSVRGNYQRDDARGYTRAYDLDHPWWASTAEAWWSYVAQRPYIAGGFIWTGFDYRGEPTPYNRWPNVASQFGVLDSCGFPKDNYWYYRAQWTSEPVLHLFPHWNWDGLLQADDNGHVQVWCHSNLDAVELLVNGVSQGLQQVPAYGHVEWRVAYSPGAIEARGYRGGTLVLSQRRETAGKPAAIRLSCDRAALRADAEDVAVVKVEIVDAQGRLVPNADNQVQLAVRGPARLIGVGNGDPSSHENDKAPQRKAFNGLCAALLQTTRASGTLVLEATAPALAPVRLALTSVRTKARPFVG
ncbi:glycoside hydrolase family 2 protein [Xanthomonas campestris pv. badrii]|uniref:Glycoside hydrolase family 2 protein n=1 Tax=Xanthomonas campestris pv. badrii TaxID=149696 RepID=A0A7Z2V8Q4_XANCA|nr:beta-galactosidase GalA [Xanthomonas campestris]QJD67127.1 glycoside hydrolase family 2 protein [Xanthomonas campestris pv. badrii]